MFQFIKCLLVLYMGSQCVAANPVTDYAYNRDVDAFLRLHTEPAAFFDANINCQREGGVLAIPTNDDMVQFMRTTLTDHKLTSGVFTGLAKQAKGESGKLVFGNASLSWAAGEPHNTADEECLTLSGAGALADVSCSRAHPYFCRKESANKCGYKGNGYEYEPRTGSCYKFHRISLTFRPALATCHAEGGVLAVINSDTESDVLREIFRKNPKEVITGTNDPDYALVGFKKYEDGVFATVFGDTLANAGFARWSAGEPNNDAGDEYCGSISRNGLLNDLRCTWAYAFICEITP